MEISYSILSSNFDFLENDLIDIFNSGCKYLHYDVMDGHFVNNISFGPHILKTINKEHKLINDVHLMIEKPINYIEKFVDANADIITIHYEAMKDEKELNDTINKIKSFNKMVGISIKPNTSIEKILDIITKIDLVLLMSVEPGFGGQTFIEDTFKKIEYLYNFKKENKLEFLIEVDGGINNTNFKKISDFGADIAVIGSFLAKSKNRKETVNCLKRGI